MFHPGERLAQQQAGYAGVNAAVYPQMPAQHRLFFQGLETFYLSVLDESGYPVAGVIHGGPGLLTTPNAHDLCLQREAVGALPWLPVLRPGMAVGGLGIDLASRRRNRVNGVVDTLSDNRVVLRVQESFGNCPQYIQRRLLPSESCRREVLVEPLAVLDADARYLIAAADTFFVASYAPRQQETGGADISHRGGMPGFIALREGTLFIPDYAGNRYMNTLGNLLLEPRCALLIMDFHQGAALHIQGQAEIVWQPAGQGRTERYWTVTPQRILRLRQLLPAAGTAVEYADNARSVSS